MVSTSTKWLADAFDWCVNHWAFCAFVIGMIFEVPKWKFKPFSALIGWLGKRINKPVVEEIERANHKIDAMKLDIDSLKKDVDANEMDTIRSSVLDFANTCRNGTGHSKEEFNHIVALNDKYTRLLAKYDLRNGVYEEDYKFILSIRDKCQRENSFLA